MNTTTTTKSNSGTIDSAATAAPRRNRRRMRRAIGLAVLAGTLGAAGLTSSDANAEVIWQPANGATQRVTLQTYWDDSVNLRTWFFGTTKLCVFNYHPSSAAAEASGRYNPGAVTVRLKAGAAATEIINVPANSERCVERWWGGLPVNVSYSGTSHGTSEWGPFYQLVKQIDIATY